MAHEDYLEALRFIRNVDILVVESDEAADRLWAGRRLPLAFTSDYDSRWAHFPDDNGIFVDKLGARFRVEAQPHLASECIVTYQLSSAYTSIETSYQALVVAKITWRDFLKKRTVDEQRLPTQVLRQVFWDRVLRKLPLPWREVILVADLHLGDDSKLPRVSNGVKLPKVYDKLDDPTNIRLVSIHPALGTHESIRCSLYQVQLDSLPDFEALSYTWGSHLVRRDIFLNEVRFSVTENLYFALESLRRRETTRVMWIDAICINQSNIAEREEQVAQMDVLYSRATEVVVWLGPETATSSIAFKILNDSLEGLEPSGVPEKPTWKKVEYTVHSGTHLLGAPPSEVPPAARQSLDHIHGWYTAKFDSIRRWGIASQVDVPEAVEAFLNLLRRNYWKRMWVLQEVILAKKVTIQCGRKSANWYHFFNWLLIFRRIAQESLHAQISTQRRFSLFIDLTRRINDIFPFIFMHRDDRSAEKAAAESMACFLSMTAASEASDPRDKLYGLLGLLQPQSASRALFRPSYRQPPKRLFIAMTRYFLDTMNTLNVLTARPSELPDNTPTGGVTGLPSWVPNWASEPDSTSNFISLGVFSNLSTRGLFGTVTPEDALQHQTPLFQAGLDFNSNYAPTFSDFEEALNVHGLDVDRIASVYSFRHDSICRDMFLSIGLFDQPEEDMRNPEPWKEQARSIFQRANDIGWELCYGQCGDVYEHTGETLEDAFWRTLFLDRFYDVFGNPPKWARIRSLGGPQDASKLLNNLGMPPHHEKGLLGCSFPPQTPAERNRILKFQEDQSMIILEAFGRMVGPMHLALFATRNGRIGLGHHNAAVGDTVAVLYGGSVPYILREYDEGHILVGECYVHGIMDGELVREREGGMNGASRGTPKKFRII